MATNRLPVLGITMGDPAGIGPEVIVKGLANRTVRRLCRPIVIGSVEVMKTTTRALRSPLRVLPVSGHEFGEFGSRNMYVLDPLDAPLGRFTPGKVQAGTGAASAMYVKKAVQLAQYHCLDAMVTAPINKEAINLAGYHYPGHTEMLADLTGSTDVGMMIIGGPLKIMFVTTHVALRELPSTLTQGKIEKAIRLAQVALKEYFGVRRPRIGVAALNPHAGEGGLFGREEQEVIGPAACRARAMGIRASDPLPADTLFSRAAKGEFDGVVALFHDQGLIPLKLVAFGRCVNLTVGLPLVRTSVDHGTAYDIVGRGVADPGSLLEAIKVAAYLAKRRMSRAGPRGRSVKQTRRR